LLGLQRQTHADNQFISFISTAGELVEKRKARIS